MIRKFIPHVVLSTVLTFGPPALAQSTAFTYQGQLKSNGTPASGLHDFRFRLYDSPNGSSQIGSTRCFDAVSVTNGTFSVELDFGQLFASTAPRHLEIFVRREIGQPCTDDFGYVLLSPRQLLSAAPRALSANSAFALAAPDGSPSNALIVDDDGRVGLGIAAPFAALHIQSQQSGPNPGEGLRIQGTLPTPANQAYASFFNGAGSLMGYVGDGGSANNVELASQLGDARLVSAAGTVLTASASGNVGIGNTNPGGRLDIQGSDSSNILFGRRSGGGLAHNLFIDGNGNGSLQLLDAGAIPRINLGANDSTYFNYGNVGIGTTAPETRLDVRGTTQTFTLSTNFLFARSASTTGVAQVACSDVTGGVGVFGEAGGFSQGVVGVRGRSNSSDANSFGVFSAGRLGATGTKSFRIDHPESPQTHYLFHYSAESPEVINFYRGAVTLDAQGRAVVRLPSYFAKINTQPTYQLTPVGAPMPNLHVAERISDAALRLGASLPSNGPGPECWFIIAGGTPAGEVSWRVEAIRNDDFVRHNGAPAEVAKPAHEQGTLNGVMP